MPKKQRALITDGLVDRINQIATDPLIAEEFKENFISYITVIQQGKYSMDEYNNAVHFVTQKLLGMTDIEAYIVVFPDRYSRLRENGVERNKISPYVTAYKQNKIVVAVLEQSLIKPYIYNSHMYQGALDVQGDLMLNARSEMVRSVAATAILTQLKPPESLKIEHEHKVSTTSIVDDYENVMRELARRKVEMMKQGGDVKTIANFDLTVEAEIIEEI